MRCHINYVNDTAKYQMSRATSGSAGVDCVACKYHDIEPGSVELVSLGFRVALYCQDEHNTLGDFYSDPPNNYVGLLLPRSGLATKRGLTLANNVGVIDADYRGEVKAAMYNRSKEKQSIKIGDRVCQFLVVPIMTPILEEVEEFLDEDNKRGANGFGSSGT